MKFKGIQTPVNEIVELYNEFIKNHNLEGEFEYLNEESYRSVEGLLGRIRNIIGSYNKKYRYYDISKLSYDDIKRLAELLDLEPGIYSTELFIKTNPLLIKELDIQDEYELHNLLRKIFSNNTKLNFSRMPDISIDYNKGRLDLIEAKIKELSPIAIDDFCQFLCDNYGYKFDITKYAILGNFKIYIDNNVLKTENKVFTEEERNIMKECLTEDLYSIDTLKNLLTEKLDVNNFELINNLNFSEIGYYVRGNYILKSSIANFESYLYNKILSNSYYIPESEYKKIGSTFSTYTSRLMNNKELFRYQGEKYITIKGLNELGITKEDIEELQNEIIRVISDNEYFNLTILKPHLSLAKFENKGLTDEFYETIIFIIPELKMFRIDNNKMFIKSDISSTKENFISSIIEKTKKITVYELKEFIKNKYQINIPESEIKKCINKNRFYYQEGTETIYLNQEIYDNEVDEWDILKYID